jgi:hypothetical protein
LRATQQAKSARIVQNDACFDGEGDDAEIVIVGGTKGRREQDPMEVRERVESKRAPVQSI